MVLVWRTRRGLMRAVRRRIVIALKANQYWGRRSGAFTNGEFVFVIPRGRGGSGGRAGAKVKGLTGVERKRQRRAARNGVVAH